MSVVGVSPGSADALSPRAVQPVALYNSQGMAATPGVNTDGSQNISGINGTSKATAANPQPVALSPNTLPSSGVTTTATTAVAGSLILKASAGNFYGFNVVAGASAGYLMIFNSTTVPADGAVTPLRVYAVAANASLSVSWDIPRYHSAGIALVFSTTGPFAKAISATAFISGEFV